MSVGYDREPQDDRDELYDRLVPDPQSFEARGDEGRHGGFSDPTQCKRSNRNTHLADGEVGVEVSQDTVNHTCPSATFLLELDDARLPHPHQRELRRHEEPIQDDQDQRRKDADRGEDRLFQG